MEKKTFFYVAIGCLALSFISLFFPVITYVNEKATKASYSVFTLITKSSEFEETILRKYKGPVVWDITGGITVILVVIFIAALLCAVIGLITLRAQRPNTWQFILTIIGLAGVAVPSLVLIICVLGYGKYFPGKLTFGLAPIITIASMIVCIFAVIRRKNRVAEELQRELAARGLIRRGGDL